MVGDIYISDGAGGQFTFPVTIDDISLYSALFLVKIGGKLMRTRSFEHLVQNSSQVVFLW